MSTPGNTSKPSAIYTATYRQHKVVQPWLGANLQCISQHTLSQLINPLCQQGITREKIIFCMHKYNLSLNFFGFPSQSSVTLSLNEHRVMHRQQNSHRNNFLCVSRTKLSL